MAQDSLEPAQDRIASAPDTERRAVKPAQADPELFAALDLGTNSCRMLIATPEGGHFRVVDAFAKLPSQIPTIVAFEHGINNSPENLNDGLTHCFLVSFANEAGREAYLPHPAHKAFVEVLKPHMEKVVVIDYWAK